MFPRPWTSPLFLTYRKGTTTDQGHDTHAPAGHFHTGLLKIVICSAKKGRRKKVCPSLRFLFYPDTSVPEFFDSQIYKRADSCHNRYGSYDNTHDKPPVNLKKHRCRCIMRRMQLCAVWLNIIKANLSRKGGWALLYISVTASAKILTQSLFPISRVLRFIGEFPEVLLYWVR